MLPVITDLSPSHKQSQHQRSQLKIVSSMFSTRCTKEHFQSQSRENLEQFATRCCQLYICHDVQEKTGQVPYGLDMSVKGAAYQAHYHQSQTQDAVGHGGLTCSRNFTKGFHYVYVYVLILFFIQPSLTRPGARPTSLPSGILIHATVWQ